MSKKLIVGFFALIFLVGFGSAYYHGGGDYGGYYGMPRGYGNYGGYAPGMSYSNRFDYTREVDAIYLPDGSYETTRHYMITTRQGPGFGGYGGYGGGYGGYDYRPWYRQYYRYPSYSYPRNYNYFDTGYYNPRYSYPPTRVYVNLN